MMTPKEYKRCYYLLNRERLIQYSKNYYQYKKWKESDIMDENMRLFLSKYKKNKTPQESEDRIKIRNEKVVLIFD